LGERELALRRLACNIRFFVDADWEPHLLQACNIGRRVVGPVVCSSLYFLDVLPAQIATADIGCRTESASTRPASTRCRCPERSGEARQSGQDNLSTTGQLAVAGCKVAA